MKVEVKRGKWGIGEGRSEVKKEGKRGSWADGEEETGL